MKTEIMVPKYYKKWMVFSVSVWFVAGWGRNLYIWRWKVIIETRRQSGAGELSDFVWVHKVFFGFEKDFILQQMLKTRANGSMVNITKTK